MTAFSLASSRDGSSPWWSRLPLDRAAERPRSLIRHRFAGEQVVEGVAQAGRAPPLLLSAVVDVAAVAERAAAVDHVNVWLAARAIGASDGTVAVFEVR